MNEELLKQTGKNKLITLNNGVKVDPNDLKHPLLVHESCVPPCSKENYIINGYMIPYMPVSYYWKTLYTVNYDFVNVWTHLLPSCYACWMLYHFSKTIDLVEAWPLLVLTIGVILVFLLSTIAHVFHGKSAAWHRTVFTLDYFGICLNAFTQTICHYHASADVALFKLVHSNIMLISTVLSCIGFTCYAFTQLDNHPHASRIKLGKKISNAMYFVYKLTPCLHRFLILGHNWTGLKYHILQAFFLGTSPLILGSPYPQKLSPGNFDIIGHSHMWFHIWTSIGCYCDIFAIYYDVTSPDGAWKNLKKLESYPTLDKLHIYSLFFGLYSLAVIVYTNSRIRKNEEAKQLKKS